MDKAGIVIAIVIVAAAVAFTATGGTGQVTDMSTNVKQAGAPLQQFESEAREKSFEAASEVQKKSSEVLESVQKAGEKTREAVEMAGESMSAKLPSKVVKIPAGTSTPGCEGPDLCYDPARVTIFVDGTVIWKNEDTSAHTVTSGSAINGPDGLFDSGLIMPEETFSARFATKGTYEYFCMIHPWATGSVIVN